MMELLKQRGSFPLFFVLLVLGFVMEGFAKSPSTEHQEYWVVLKEPAALQARATSPWKAKASPGLPSAYARSLQAKQEKLIHAIQGKHLQLRVGRRFVSLLNAFVVEGSETALADLAASPEVAFLAPNRLLQPRLTQTGQSMALSLAWDRLGGGGMAGRNVLVGIIDTGIDISNPSFDPTGWIYPPGFPKGEPAYTTPKVIVARAFPRNPNSSTTPWQNYIPWDQAGHGTDVASIVGANYQTVSPLGQVSGIAPGIYLGNYKVFVESGGASTDQMVAALEQAVEDGCDIVNLSLGVDTFYDPRQDPAHIAIQNTIDQGVVVVVAAGNTGVSNTVGGIAGVDDVIAVGSISNSHQKGTPVPTDEVLIEVWVDQERVLYDIVARVGLSDQPFSHPLLGTYPVQDIDFLDGGTYGGTEDGLVCDTLALSQPLAGWTLVQRGICDFTDKANRIAAEGAVGMLLYDNRDSVDIPLLAGNVLPTVMVDRDDGLAIKDLLLRHASTAIQITLSAFPARKAGNTAGYLSGFSSGGPAAEFVVKPDLLAIGEGSYGATQNDFNSSDYDVSGFKWFSGTSMSSPRVAGVAALLKQAHPEWRPSWIKSALQLSAESFVPKNLGSRTNASLLFRGAGRVDANAASQADTLALPAVLNFGKRVWVAPQTQTAWTTVINTSPISCTYQWIPLTLADGVSIEVTPSTLTLASGARADVRVDLHVITTPPQDGMDGELLLFNQTTGREYRLQYWIAFQHPPIGSADILLVDDDNGLSFQTFYQTALDTQGFSYATWDVKAQGAYPVADVMRPFDTVIWFLSAKSLNEYTDKTSMSYILDFNSRHLFETDLQRYLAEGGNLLLSGQDYLDDKESAMFSRETLGVELRTRDAAAQSIAGISGNPVGNAFLSTSLVFPSAIENLVDDLRLVRPEAQPAFYANSNTLRRVGVTMDTCTYRSVFLAFPLETMSQIAAQTILRNSLLWFAGKSAASQGLASFTPPRIDLAVDSPPYIFRASGQGFVMQNGYQARLQDWALQSVTRVDCQTITGEIPSTITPGTYSFSLTTGDGHTWRLPQAIEIINSASVREWSEFES